VESVCRQGGKEGDRRIGCDASVCRMRAVAQATHHLSLCAGSGSALLAATKLAHNQAHCLYAARQNPQRWRSGVDHAEWHVPVCGRLAPIEWRIGSTRLFNHKMTCIKSTG
jgi:hypothetical protein